MPRDSFFDIEVNTYANTKEFVFSNIGPYVEECEKDKILKAGYRGGNAKKICSTGQGLGLSQINPILQLHKEWVETTFDIRINNSRKPQMIDGIPYSKFSVVLSFEDKMTGDTGFINTICINSLPDIILHNVMQILNIDIAQQITDSLRREDRNLFYPSCLMINSIKFDLLLLQYLDVEELSIFGNQVKLDIYKFVKQTSVIINLSMNATATEVIGSCYKTISVPSSFKTIFPVFIQKMLEYRSFPTDSLIIDFSDKQLSIFIEGVDLERILNDKSLDIPDNVDEKNYKEFGINLCLTLMENMNEEIEYEISNNKFNIYLL